MAVAELINANNYDSWRRSASAQASVPFSFDANGTYEQFDEKRSEFRHQYDFALNREEIYGRVSKTLSSEAADLIKKCIEGVVRTQEAGLSYVATISDPEVVDL
jgi:hypothetical protein